MHVDLDQVAKVHPSIRGATLGVNVTDHFFGGLKVDFAEDVSMMKDYAKPLLLEVLARHGAMIQEFSTWDIEVGGKEILLRGSFTSSGIQRVCSILDTPADLRAAEPSKGADGKENPNLVAQTTLQYYKMLAQFLSDLRNEQQTATTETPGLVAMWYKQYANKIDGMPVLHVDPGLVQLGGQISGALRQAQAAMQGAGVKEASGIANMQGAQVYDYQEASGSAVAEGRYGGTAAVSGYAYRYAYNPWASLREDGQEVGQIQINARIQGYRSANQTMDSIETAMGNARKKLSEKYQIEF